MDSAADASVRGISPQGRDIQYPAAFRAADQAAIAGQRSYRRLLGIELVAVVGGTLMGAAIGLVMDSIFATALITALTFFAAIAARVIRELRRDDQRWFDGRAVAESAKTQTWRYMMRVPPFDDDASADRRFIGGLASLMRGRGGIAEPADAGPDRDSQISTSMRHVRALSLTDRRATYVEARLMDQARWYRSSGKRHQLTGHRWSWISLGSEAVAVVVAGLSIAAPAVAEFGILGVLGAAAAAATAWSQVGRHDELAKAYSLAYHEILAICDLAEQAIAEEDLARIVVEGESAISREHTMWIAKRTELGTPESDSRAMAGES